MKGVVSTRIYKDKQFLIFDFEDGKTVKYDFATKTAIGKKGKPVKDLRSQLSGMTMKELIECCDDQKYAKFLKFVQNKSYYSVYNIGTILSIVPRYAKFEQIFSAGFEDIVDSNYFSKTIHDIPKSLVKVARDRQIRISDRRCDFWKHNPDAHCIGYELDYISLTDENILNIWSYERGYRDETSNTYKYESYFNTLIDDYGYNPKALFLYVDSLKTYEALGDISYIMRELYDYARMMKTISNKFEKYPRNFLTTHKIACRNYNRLKKEFSEEIFKSRIKTGYECSYKDYQFIYPKSTQEIKDEAVQQNNCVASYIDNVIDGKCHIMFLRKKDSLKDSLVTLEIRENKIVQAKRHFNEPVTEEDQKAIDYWNRKFVNKESAA